MLIENQPAQYSFFKCVVLLTKFWCRKLEKMHLKLSAKKNLVSRLSIRRSSQIKVRKIEFLWNLRFRFERGSSSYSFFKCVVLLLIFWYRKLEKMHLKLSAKKNLVFRLSLQCSDLNKVWKLQFDISWWKASLLTHHFLNALFYCLYFDIQSWRRHYWSLLHRKIWFQACGTCVLKCRAFQLQYYALQIYTFQHCLTLEHVHTCWRIHDDISACGFSSHEAVQERCHTIRNRARVAYWRTRTHCTLYTVVCTYARRKECPWRSQNREGMVDWFRISGRSKQGITNQSEFNHI